MSANAADRKSIRRQEKEARQSKATRDDVTKGIMSTTSGRAWIMDFLEAAHVFRLSFNPSPLITAFSEGERNIGLQLLASITDTCPEQYTLMLQERNHKDAARDTVAERSSREDTGRDDSGQNSTPTNIVIDGQDFVYTDDRHYGNTDEDGAYQQ